MLQSHKTYTSAKLVDFGLSEVVQHTPQTSDQRSGTEGYLAPEILRGEAYDTSSDLWSLGCLLYAMLTVSLPFPSSDSGTREETGTPSKGKKKGYFSGASYQLDVSQIDIGPLAGVESECIDLILCLLQKNPAARPNV